MTTERIANNTNWLEQSQNLIHAACTPWGIKASLTNQDNYGAIFTRDAVMAGIAGILLKDEIVIEGLKNTLIHLKRLQGNQGQIASNFTVTDGRIEKVSFGTLSPKIDSCTWYLIGVGLLLQEGSIHKNDFHDSIIQVITLLDGLEYNGKHLLYIPKGGNWADEYIYDGYVLYDQVLRAWGLSLVALCYGNKDWSDKSKAILACIAEKYVPEKGNYLHASFFPGGVFPKFDLAAHALAGVAFGKENLFFEKSLDWVIHQFIYANKLPPVFHPVITETEAAWETLRKYHLFAFKNKPHHYHNGGIWWIWLGWLAVTLALWKKEQALNQLLTTAFQYLDGLGKFDFDEYIAADDLRPGGTQNLCYTATGIILLSLAQKSFDFSLLNPTQLPLINEPFLLKDEYFALSDDLVEYLKQLDLLQKEKLVIAICGESGSGKSITAKCLQLILEKNHIPTIILHQDSYYKLPPKENHEKRKADLGWVGSNEVQLDLLQTHIDQFRSGKKFIKVPVVDYEKNTFSLQNIPLHDKSVLIVEGVYAFFMENLDCKIFMEKTFQESLEKRQKRTREVYDPFVERVLAIEQALVKPLGKQAHVTISSAYEVRPVNS